MKKHAHPCVGFYEAVGFSDALLKSGFDFADGADGMFVTEVGFIEDTLDAGGIEKVEADVDVQRDDGKVVVDQDGFGLLEKFRAGVNVRRGVGGAEKRVVAVAGPAGAVVWVGAREQIQEGVWIGVIAD